MYHRTSDNSSLKSSTLHPLSSPSSPPFVSPVIPLNIQFNNTTLKSTLSSSLSTIFLSTRLSILFIFVPLCCIPYYLLPLLSPDTVKSTGEDERSDDCSFQSSLDSLLSSYNPSTFSPSPSRGHVIRVQSPSPRPSRRSPRLRDRAGVPPLLPVLRRSTKRDLRKPFRANFLTPWNEGQVRGRGWLCLKGLGGGFNLPTLITVLIPPPPPQPLECTA